MFRITRRQRRRWTLPLVALLLLHWIGGIGEAAASYICLESAGQVKLELAGKRCCDHPAAKPALKTPGKSCIDLPADDDNPGDDPLPGPSDQTPDLGALTAVIPLAFFVDPVYPDRLLLTKAPTDPPTPNRPVTLRATTVLLI